eukprot:TRINITY_DN29039_c0_g4_i1.p1 TRINITY_DN29039_c0_g4~~TRINITY_DN29039_c0_g4_i1.p1  ORF type:complete len:565 (-),score=128.22 TRINITY_DN29039_c0_g4_i1:110-1804(-)
MAVPSSPRSKAKAVKGKKPQETEAADGDRGKSGGEGAEAATTPRRRKGKEERAAAAEAAKRQFPVAWTPYFPVPDSVAYGEPWERPGSLYIEFDLEALWAAEEAAGFAPFESCGSLAVDRTLGLAVLKEDFSFEQRHFGTDYVDAPSALFKEEAESRSIIGDIVKGYRLLQQPIDLLILSPPRDESADAVFGEWQRRLHENRVELVVQTLLDVSGLPREKIKLKTETFSREKHPYGRPGAYVFRLDLEVMSRARLLRDDARNKQLWNIIRRENWHFDPNTGVLLLLRDDLFKKKFYARDTRRESVSARCQDEDYCKDLMTEAAAVYRLFPTSMEVVRSQEAAIMHDRGVHDEWSKDLAENRVEFVKNMLVELGVPEDQVACRAALHTVREGQGVKFRRIRCYDRIAAKTALLKAFDNPVPADVPKLRRALEAATACKLREVYPDLYLTEARELLARLELKAQSLARTRTLQNARSMKQLRNVGVTEAAPPSCVVPAGNPGAGAARRGRSTPPEPLRQSAFAPEPTGLARTPRARREPHSPRKFKPGGCPLGFEGFTPMVGASAL